MDDYVVPPMTQGQRKTRQRLKELFANLIFQEELADIMAIPNKNKLEKELWKFAYKYRLEYGMGSPLLDLIIDKDSKLDKQRGFELDVCHLYDAEDKYLNDNFPRDFDLPPSRKNDDRSKIMAYPIHIGISMYATKRDVLDFINKRWDHISYMLYCYANEQPTITRKKLKADRDDLIWENRGKPSKEIATIVNDKFPDENVTYANINSILYYLKRRRLSSLA
jgi:hypothetical protein